MASGKELLLQIGIDQAELDKMLKSFGTQFRSAMRKALNISDAIGAKHGIELKFNVAATQRDFERVKKHLKITAPLKLDLKDARAQIQAFQAGLKPLQLGVALVEPNKDKADPGAPDLNPAISRSQKLRQDIIATERAIEGLKRGLHQQGLALVDVEKKTQGFDRAVLAAKVRLDQLDASLEDTSPDVDKITRAFERLDTTLDGVRRTIGRTDIGKIVNVDEAKKVDQLFKNFAFSLGLVSYGLANVGRQMIGITQSFANLVQQSAQAGEGFERIENLLKLDPTLTSEKVEAVLDKMREIADLPGANIEKVADSFRVLNTLDQPLDRTIQLVEGLTKAAALSGVGAEGVAHLAQQLRQFSQSKQVRELDIKAITEQGGRPVVEVLKEAFGEVSAVALTAAGPQAVLDALINGLTDIEAPALTAVDQINRLRNSLIQLGLLFNDVLAPAFEQLHNFIKDNLEPRVDSLASAFESLTEAQKKLVSAIVVGVPVAIGALGALLTVFSVLGIGVAAGGRGIELLRGGLFKLSEAAGISSKNLGANVAVLARGTVVYKSAQATLIGVVASLKELVFYSQLAAINLGTGGGILKGLQTFILGGPKLVGILGGISSGLASILPWIPRILGLTGPVGIIVNLLLALATNAGHARDVVMDALGGLFTSFGKLFEQLDKFFNGTAGSGILNFLNAFYNLIGGVLGAVLATAIDGVTKWINLVTEFFGLLNEPSVDGLRRFADALVQATLGWAVTLGRLLAAAFIDAFIDLAGNNAITRRAFLAFSPFPGDYDSPAAQEIVGKGLGEGRNVASFLRNYNLPGLDPNGVGAVNEEVEDTKNAVDALNESLEFSNKLFDDMAEASAKASASFAKARADISLAQIRFENAERQRRAREQLDRSIKAQGAGAIPAIKAEGDRSTAEGTREIVQEKTLDIKARIAEMQLAGRELNRAFDEFAKTGPVISGQAGAAIQKFRKDLDALFILAQSGKANTENFGAAFDKVVGQFQNFIPLLGVLKEDSEKSLGDLSKVYSDRVLPAITNVNSGLFEQNKAIQDLTNTNEKGTQALIANAEAVERQAKAAAAAKKPITELAALEADYNRRKAIVDSGQVSDAEFKLFEQARDRFQKRREELQDQIEIVQKADEDKVATIQESTKKEVEAIQTVTENTIESTNLRIQLNQSLMQSYRDGFSALDTFRDKLDAINDVRTEMGFAPRVTIPDSSIGAQLQADTTPITNRNRELKASEVLGEHPLLGTENMLDVIVQSLKTSIALTSEFSDVLSKVALVSSAGLVNLQNKITQNAEAIERQRKVVADATGEGKSKTVLAEAEATFNALLVTQTKLGEEATIYSNRLAIVNKILEANEKLVKEQLKSARGINAAATAELKRRQEELELRIRLAEVEESNRVGKGTLPGGSLKDLADSLDPTASSKAAATALEKQIELLTLKHKLELESIELKKIEAKEALDLKKISQEEFDARMKAYGTQIELLNKIHKADKRAADDARAKKSADDYRKSLEGVYDVYFQRVIEGFSESLRKAADSTVKNFSIMAEAGELFKNIGAFAIVGAFAALGDALIRFLETGEGFIEGFMGFLGSMLIGMGEMLIQMSMAAVAMAFMTALPGGIFAAFAAAAAAAPMAALGVAVGAGLILVGSAMGGQGKYSASESASANTANAANSATGASGLDEYDPDKDPRTLYQKGLMDTRIFLDIRHDDGIIVKKVIKAVNSNGRLSNLIGNRKLEFGY